MLMEFGLRVENTPFTPMNSSDENSISFDSIIQYIGAEPENVRIAIFAPNQISLKKFTSKTKQFGIGNDGFPDSADFFLFKLFVAQSLVQNHTINIAIVSTYNYSASCYVIARWLIDERGYKFTQAIEALNKALPGKEIDFGLKEKLIKRYSFNENPIYCQSNQFPFYDDTKENTPEKGNNSKIEEKIVLIDSPQKNDIIDRAKRKPPKPPPLPISKITPQIEKEKLSPEKQIINKNTILPNDQSHETNPSKQNQPTKQLQVKQPRSLTNFDENSQKQQWPLNSSSIIPSFEDSPQKKEETGQIYQNKKQSYHESNQQKQEQHMDFAQSYTYPYQYEEIHVLNSNFFNQQSHRHDHHHHSEIHTEEKHKHHHHQNSDYQYYYNKDSYNHLHENPSSTYEYPEPNVYNRYYQHEDIDQDFAKQPPQNYSNDTSYYTYDVPNHSDPYQTTSYYDQRGYYSNYDQQQQFYQQRTQSYYSYNEQQDANHYPYPSQQNMASAYPPPPQANYDYSDHYPPNYQDSYQYRQQYQNEYPSHNDYNYNYHMQNQYQHPPSQPPPVKNDRPEYHDVYYDQPVSFNKFNYNNPQHIPPNETPAYHPDPPSYYNPPEPHHLQQPPKDQIIYPNDQKSSLKIDSIQIPPPSLPPLPSPSPPPLPPPPFISQTPKSTKSLLEDQKGSQSDEVEEIEQNPHFRQIPSISSNFSVFDRIPISRVGFDSSPDEFVEVCKDIATILAIKNLNIQNIKSLPFTHEEQLTDESFEIMKNCQNKEFMFRPIPAGNRCFLVARGSKRFLISNDMCREVKVSLFSPNSENIIQNAVRSLFEGFLIRLEDENKPYFLITDCFYVNADFSQLPYFKRLEEAEKMVVMQQSKNNIQDNLLLRAVETFQINQFDEIQSKYHFDYEILGFAFFSPNSIRQSVLNQFNFNESNGIGYELDNSICCNCMFNWFTDGFPIVQINISGNMKCVGLARRNGSDELIKAVDFGFAKKTMLRFNKKIVDLEYSSNLLKWQIKCISSKYKTWYADDVKNIIYGKEVMPCEEVKLKIGELISS